MHKGCFRPLEAVSWAGDSQSWDHPWCLTKIFVAALKLAFTFLSCWDLTRDGDRSMSRPGFTKQQTDTLVKQYWILSDSIFKNIIFWQCYDQTLGCDIFSFEVHAPQQLKNCSARTCTRTSIFGWSQPHPGSQSHPHFSLLFVLYISYFLISKNSLSKKGFWNMYWIKKRTF